MLISIFVAVRKPKSKIKRCQRAEEADPSVHCFDAKNGLGPAHEEIIGGPFGGGAPVVVALRYPLAEVYLRPGADARLAIGAEHLVVVHIPTPPLEP